MFNCVKCYSQEKNIPSISSRLGTTNMWLVAILYSEIQTHPTFPIACFISITQTTWVIYTYVSSVHGRCTSMTANNDHLLVMRNDVVLSPKLGLEPTEYGKSDMSLPRLG